MLNKEAREWFRRQGSRGGKKLLRMRGKSHFSRAAKARWDKVKKLSTRGLQSKGGDSIVKK